MFGVNKIAQYNDPYEFVKSEIPRNSFTHENAIEILQLAEGPQQTLPVKKRKSENKHIIAKQAWGPKTQNFVMKQEN